MRISAILSLTFCFWRLIPVLQFRNIPILINRCFHWPSHDRQYSWPHPLTSRRDSHPPHPEPKYPHRYPKLSSLPTRQGYLSFSITRSFFPIHVTTTFPSTHEPWYTSIWWYQCPGLDLQDHSVFWLSPHPEGRASSGNLFLPWRRSPKLTTNYPPGLLSSRPSN